MRRGLALAALAAVAVGGCGSTPLSLTALRTQATRICTNATHSTGRIPAPSSPAGIAAYLQQGIAVLRGELAQLRTLKPSSDVADVYSRAISMFTQKLGALTSATQAINAGTDPTAALRKLQGQLAPVESQEDDAWRALEVPACVNR